MKLKFFSGLILMTTISLSAMNNDHNHTGISTNVQKLLAPTKGDIYFSAFPGFEGGVSANIIDEFESLSKKKIAWVPFCQYWFKSMAYPIEEIHTIHNRGAMPYVKFMPNNNFMDFSQHSNFSLINIIDGDFDTELRQWAKDAKADNIPIIIDFATEMNGDWFSWSGNANGANNKRGYGDKNKVDGPEIYRDAYRHIIDIFRAEKVNNVTWFFHPILHSSPDKEWNRAKNYYPGDNYIDWIGVSIYGATNPQQSHWQTFSQKLKENYQNILEISSSKPFAVLEFGVTDHHAMGNKSAWLEDAFSTILSKKYIDFKAISYWHESWEESGEVASLKIDSSEKSLKTFQKLAANKHFISKVRTTPSIQTPAPIATLNTMPLTAQITTNIPINPNKKQKVLAPKQGEIYFAAFPDFGGEENIVTEKRIDDFESLARKEMAWIPFSQNWFQGMHYPKKEIHLIHSKGAVPYVRFMPRSDFDEHKTEPKYSLINIINGDFDKELHLWAKNAKEDNIPLIIDFAVEMNGNWFGWSGTANGADSKREYGDKDYYDGPEKYRDAYRHIIDIFRAEKVNHVSWFFHPNLHSSPNRTWNKPKQYYPGDDYIDWIGVSVYGPGNTGENYWATFSQKLEENYQNILEISSSKPFAVLEFGVTDNHPRGSKSEWLKDAFSTILSKKYIDFKAINYWHETWDHHGYEASIRIDSSSRTLRTFQNLVADNRFVSQVNMSSN